MKIKPYFDKLSASKEYKDFQKSHSDAFMIAGFFILDLETGNNIHQLDYYVPSEKKIAAFTLDKGVVMQMLDMMNSKIVPEKLDIITNVDLDALHGILEDEMKNRSITDGIKKIIAILQTIDGKKVWNINCVLSGMNILKAHIDDESKTILKMERKSVMDYVKKIPAEEIKKMQNKREAEALGEESEKEIKEKLKGLKDIEDELKKKEDEYEKELKKRSPEEEKESKDKKSE